MSSKHSISSVAILDGELGSSEPFSLAEYSRMRAYLAHWLEKGYDIELESCNKNPNLSGGMCKGIMAIRSCRLGYKCILMNVNKRRGFFQLGKSSVKMFISNINNDEYFYVTEERNLINALRAFEKIYKDAADSHLP